MEGGAKESEEETLQMAFKKLRVDADSRSGSTGSSETTRVASRASLEVSSAKTKLGCPKDNWHSCMRKSSRGSSRSQRRRRSKSPILHPPKFTYCSSAALSPPGGCLKQQRLVVTSPPDTRLVADGCGPSAAAGGLKEAGFSGPPDHAPLLVFGSCASFETREEGGSVGAESAEAADFRSLSELRGDGCAECRAAEVPEDAAARCRCRPLRSWNGVEVYAFTGLRDVMSECESVQSPRDAPRTLGSPRSCSEQARGVVDDVTIEDLAGYMEYYLYFPKKMSHMAEMMYT
ncbi:unnamed protein product [Ophioblennius macclurei]